MRRTTTRGLALATIAGLTLSASLLGTPASARAELPAKPPVAATVSHTNVLSAEVKKLMKGSGAEAEAKALAAYWTPARMKAAKSIDGVVGLARSDEAPRQQAKIQPDGPAGGVAPAKTSAPGIARKKATASSKIAPQAGMPNLPSDHPAARTNGKVFFNQDGGSYVCSASIVNSEGKSLVWTAGHCLVDYKVWSTNVAFVPAYSNGSRPHGTWYARDLTTLNGWYSNRDWAYDVGAMTMKPNFNYRIADYFGAQGIRWNQSIGYTATAFGYPAASPYNGQYLWTVAGSTADSGRADDTIYMYSELTGGSSGGPWFRDFDGNWGWVNGHNDFIYLNSPAWMYSPYYGSQVANLYDAVRYRTTVLKLTPATPKVSGTAKVGKILTAKPGTWKPAPVALSYQWKANGKAIVGATGSTLTVPGSAKGKKITVTVTGSKTGYPKVTKTSKATKKVKAGTLSGAKPTITGTTTVGQILTATIGAWNPSDTTLTYQWYRNSKKIKNAKALTYTLVKADKGKKISIKVTGKKTGYTNLTKASKKTGKVKAV